MQNSQPPLVCNRLLGLEVIRFISAFAVLVWHYQHFYYFSDSPIGFVRDSQPFADILRVFYSRGYLGVQVFWCISGFIFFWKYSELIPGKRVSAADFFVLRASRLYPLHFVTLILVLFLQFVYFDLNGVYFVYQNNDFLHFVSQLFLASNWFSRFGDSFNGPIWSISIEVLIYAVFFVFLRFVGNSVFYNLAAVFLVVLLLMFGSVDNIVLCFGCFYSGGAAAILKKRARGFRFEYLVTVVLCVILGVVPLVLWCSGLVVNNKIISVFLLLYIPLVLFFAAFDIRLGKRLQSFIQVAGNMTYSSYLIHFPLQLMLVLLFAVLGFSLPVTESWFFIIFIVTVFACSYVVYEKFEMPMQSYFRSKFGLR